ncbi:adenine deaminase [Niabella terrae]
MEIEGNIVDIQARKIYPGKIRVEAGRIVELVPMTHQQYESYILPGFVDSHVHIESSMLVPSEFARLAVVHGTVATISDPHEIANVCGVAGVEYMIENGRSVPFKFNFGAPSCVPATAFETAGGRITVDDIKQLLARDEIRYLAEMMNFPGVLSGDKEVMAKIKAAHDLGKPVDGHAPGLRGADAQKYAAALNPALGEPQATDHECFTRQEAIDKLDAGMKILIREGSAAKNFEALIDLLPDHAPRMMFCSDDKHPDSLMVGHINQLCARAVARGIDVYKVLQAACINPVLHYKLDVGLLQPGDPADFIQVKDLRDFEVEATYIDGRQVAVSGRSLIDTTPANLINHFKTNPKQAIDFAVPFKGQVTIPVIEALEGQLITNRLDCPPRVSNNEIVADTDQDILKIAVINRYQNAPVACGFIRNMGLSSGALASSVAHDSHNIVVVGADDQSMAAAANLIIREKGGISAVNNRAQLILPLPVGGIMTNADGYQTAALYTEIDQMAREMGSSLPSPFMTLSFMALLVIPALKMSDKGLFDGIKFAFVPTD